nr:MAG TPA: hypothetical protein [Caudoviricetes sp.]
MKFFIGISIKIKMHYRICIVFIIPLTTPIALSKSRTTSHFQVFI